MLFRKHLSAIAIAALLTFTTRANAAALQKRASGEFYAINYGIDRNNCPSVSFVEGQLNTLKAYTGRIKSFSLAICNEGDLIMQATQAVGLRLYLGLWVGPDANAFEAEKNKLIEMTKSYNFNNVDGIVVGSEALYRGDVTPQILQGYISQVKQALTAAGLSVPVATADVYYKFDPLVVAKTDFLMMNAFPYWEGVAIDSAVSTLFSHYDYVKTISAGKPVVIGETGWPTHGSSFGASVASVPNQETYLKGILCQARQMSINVCWFEGLDESYKGADVEGNFGFLDSNGNPKSSSYPAIFQNPC